MHLFAWCHVVKCHKDEKHNISLFNGKLCFFKYYRIKGYYSFYASRVPFICFCFTDRDKDDLRYFINTCWNLENGHNFLSFTQILPLQLNNYLIGFFLIWTIERKNTWNNRTVDQQEPSKLRQSSLKTLN